MTTKHVVVSTPRVDIFHAAQECWNLFENISDQTHTKTPLLWRVVNDYQQRYRSWLVFLRVFAQGNSSLDHRLRNSEEVKSLVLHQLHVTRKNLRAASEFLNLNKDIVIEVAGSSEGLKGLQPVVKATLSGVQSALERLDQLGYAIRQASAGQLMSQVKPISSDPQASSFEILVHTVAETLYPDASSGLLEHISHSLARKYQLILHRQKREEMYRSFPWEDNRSISSRQPRPRDDLRDSKKETNERVALGSNLLVNKLISTPPTTPSSRFSQNIFKQLYKPSGSVHRGASKAPTSVRTGFAKYCPPQTIPEGESQPSCPWCLEPHPAIMFKTPEKWRMHVERDWSPYVCISEKCAQLSRIPSFAKVSEWKQHMELEHSSTWSQTSYRQSTWVCDLNHGSSTDTAEEFPTEIAFEEHMAKFHDEFALSEVQAMAKYSTVRLDRAANICPLCTSSIDEKIGSKDRSERNTSENDLSNKPLNSMENQFGNISPKVEEDQTRGLEMTANSLRTSDQMATHVASHLQNVTFIALRFLSLPPSTGSEGEDSKSVNVEDDELDPADADFSDYQQFSDDVNNWPNYYKTLDSIITIMDNTTTIIDAFSSILNIKDVPKAFEMVSQQLPLLQRTIKGIYENFQSDASQLQNTDKETLHKTLMDCEARCESLLAISRGLETECRKSESSSLVWSQIRRVYVSLLRGKNQERVEILMRDILENLRLLATVGLHEHARDISVASIQASTDVELSMDDSDLEKEETISDGPPEISPNSHATLHMNKHADVMQTWYRALEAVKRDEEVKEAAVLFESLLKECMKQEQTLSTQPKSSSEHEPKNVGDAFTLVDRTLQDSTKAQQALETTLGVFAVVKGLSSFVGSMLSECPPAALAWAGVCACIPIIAAPLEQHQSMIKGLRHIYARATIYFDLTGNLLQDGVHSSDLSNSIRTNIQLLYEGILKYIMLSICSVHRGKFSRFWEAISGQAQWETLLNNIEKAEESSLRNIQTIHGSKLLAVTAHFSERYTRAADREEDRRRNEYLHQLKGMDYQTRLNTTRRRLDGTCQWFRQHPGFRDWLDSDVGLLLVSASAGCGKSVLAKYLIEELLHEEDAGATVCYFFFKDSDPQARSCLNASKAILHGFLKSNPEMVDTCMGELPIITDKISNTDLWSAFNKLSRAQGAGRIICVLDALDECDPTERDGLIRNLKDYVIGNHETTGAKFIVTTRGYPQIVDLFTDFSSNKIHLDGDSDEETRQIQKEVSIVMDHRLNKLETTMPDISPATLDIIRTGLIDNSTEQRTYLWMHLMFDYIRKNRFCTREEWREIFRNPPDTVNRTYEGLLQSVTPSSKERVRTLLALILAADRPLTIAELNTAVNCRMNTLESRDFDLDDIPDEKEFGSWIKWQCGSFVTIYEGQAFLIHQTAKQFLLEPTDADHGQWQGSMTKHVIHQYMAESCLSFISLGKFQRLGYIDHVQTEISSTTEKRGHYDDESINFEPPDFKGLYLEPFVVYSASNWMRHFRECQHSNLSESNVLDIGENFFELYLSLFFKEQAGRYGERGEWKQQAWYLILMTSKPHLICPSSELRSYEYRLLSPDNFSVPDIACLFDHRRLLAFALDALEKTTNKMVRELDSQSDKLEPALSLPHFAAYGNSPWCMSHLQARGFNIDLQDCDGQTPLHKAVLCNDNQVFTALLKLGASAAIRDHCNRSPITYGRIFGCTWAREYVASIETFEPKLRSPV